MEVIVAPSQRELPSIIRRNISASFRTPQNFVGFDQNINHNLLKTDIISEEPRNFEELMLKSLGLEWNVDETDELEIDENSAQSQSEEQQRRKSGRNRKRETKQKVDADRRNVTGDETKVKDGADKDDRSQPGNRDGDNLAGELGGTNIKKRRELYREGGIWEQKFERATFFVSAEPERVGGRVAGGNLQGGGGEKGLDSW